MQKSIKWLATCSKTAPAPSGIYPTEFQHSLCLLYIHIKSYRIRKHRTNHKSQISFPVYKKDRKLFDDRRTLKSAHRNNKNRSRSTHQRITWPCSWHVVRSTWWDIHGVFFSPLHSDRRVYTKLRNFTITKLVNIQACTHAHAHTQLWCYFWLSFLQRWTAPFRLVDLQFILRYTVQNLL